VPAGQAFSAEPRADQEIRSAQRRLELSGNMLDRLSSSPVAGRNSAGKGILVVDFAQKQLDSTRKAALLPLLLIILLAVLLRLYQIDYNLDGDEIASVHISTGSFSHVIDLTIQDRVHPPLYYILLAFWIKLFGSSEVSVRALSVLISVIFLVVLYRLVLRFTDDNTALFVVLICSLSPYFVFYGEQARPYSLIACFSTLSFYFLLKHFEQPDRKQWRILYGLSCMGLIYSQYMGVLILLPEFAAIFISKVRNKYKLLSYGLAGMLSIVVWFEVMARTLTPAYLLKNDKGQTGLDWILKPVLIDIPAFYVDIFGRLPIKGNLRLSLVALLLLVAAFLVASIVIRHSSVDLRLALTLIALSSFAPVAAWLISRYGPKSIWASRQLIGSAVFFICLIGMGMTVGLRRRWVGVVLGSMLAMWCVFTVPGAFPQHSRPPWRSMARTLGDRARGEDVFGEEPWTVVPLRYYSRDNSVYDLSDYENQPDTADRIVFVCRPTRCEKLGKFTNVYRIRDKEVMSFGSAGGTQETSTIIDIYFLEREKASKT